MLNNTTTSHVTSQLDTPPAYQETTIRIKPVDYTEQKDYLIFSIFNIFCCGVLLGLPALICSIKARNNYRSSRHVEATKNAGIAKKLNIAGFVIGSICIIIIIVIRLYQIISYFSALPIGI